MSEQEFVTPEQKHELAEWKCPFCGEDAVYVGMGRGLYVDRLGIESQLWEYEWARYSCDACNVLFNGKPHFYSQQAE